LTGPVDTGLAFYRQVLNLRGYRQQILSADIANASTPGFKAVDLDFQAALAATGASAPTPSGLSDTPVAQSQPGSVWLVSDARHMIPSAGGPAASAIKYQASSAVTLDGNSVDLDQEKVTAAQNAVDYEAAATFTSQTIKMLLTAINGSQSQSNGS
jgi:flagellar basal-body rod protein FlgB